jgi:hypothetical protein
VKKNGRSTGLKGRNIKTHYFLNDIELNKDEMTCRNKIYTLFSHAVLAAVACVCLSAVNPGQKGTLTIQLNNYVGNELLKLDSGSYTNILRQTYTISEFKYYLGDIHLWALNGTAFVTNDYYLVDEENEASKKIVIHNVPANTYIGLSFILGVDSLHNCSGAQSGVLDPINGMFWSWNSGYIFLKIEGHAPASTSPGHIFEFHIGGYKPPAKCIRGISLSMRNRPLKIISGGNAKVWLKADASKIFGLPNVIDFASVSSVTDFHHAAEVADNYSGMFSVQKVEP